MYQKVRMKKLDVRHIFVVLIFFLLGKIKDSELDVIHMVYYQM